MLLVGGLTAVNDMAVGAARGQRASAEGAANSWRRRADILKARVLGLHRTSLDWLERGGEVRHRRELARDLENLSTAAAAACELLRQEPPEIKPDDSPKKPGGRPRKRQAAHVRAKAAKAYELLTGEQPTVTETSRPNQDTRRVGSS